MIMIPHTIAAWFTIHRFCDFPEVSVDVSVANNETTDRGGSLDSPAERHAAGDLAGHGTPGHHTDERAGCQEGFWEAFWHQFCDSFIAPPSLLHQPACAKFGNCCLATVWWRLLQSQGPGQAEGLPIARREGAHSLQQCFHEHILHSARLMIAATGFFVWNASLEHVGLHT